jgi:hypothetical protein
LPPPAAGHHHILPALERRRRLLETPLKRLGELLDGKDIMALRIQKEHIGFQMHMGGSERLRQGRFACPGQATDQH